jgi:hypothetical protein
MRRGRRVLPLLITLAIGIGIGIAVTVLGQAKLKNATSVPVELSVLRQPSRPLPAYALRLETVSHTEARLAMILENRSYFVVPGRGRAEGDLCLVVADPNSAAGTCFARAALRNTAAYIFSPGPGGTIDLAGIAADAFERASISGVSTRIVNNVFAFDHVRATDHFIVSGADGQLRVDLGLLRPTITVTAPSG